MWVCFFFCLSHTRWFDDDVLVTLFASLVDDRGNGKLLKCCKSMTQQIERCAGLKYSNWCAAGVCESLCANLCELAHVRTGHWVRQR